MCKWGTNRFIYVIRRNNDAIPDGWHRIAVDACIADYVQEMNNRGVISVGCCCGHGKAAGVVLVAAECISLLDRLGYEYHPFEDRCDVVVHNIPAHDNAAALPPGGEGGTMNTIGKGLAIGLFLIAFLCIGIGLAGANTVFQEIAWFTLAGALLLAAVVVMLGVVVAAVGGQTKS